MSVRRNPNASRTSRRTAVGVTLSGIVLSVLLGWVSPATAAVDASGVDASEPGVLVSTAAKAMLSDLDAHRVEYQKQPEKLEAVVTRVLLPHFDTDYAAQLVLGRHWAGATPEQRKRFVDGFYHSLLRSYSSALTSFTADRLKVLPWKGDASASTATVRSQVRKSDGSMVAVNYTLRKTDAGWKAWDVVIEGISYVKSFRDDYSAEVDRNGLDALIKRLESNGGDVRKSG
jgi:phospholipid transport system substrate-binding protein